MGVGPAQGQFGADYPLLAPSDDIRHLIADFRLVMWPANTVPQGPVVRDKKLPVSISLLQGFGASEILTTTPKNIQLTDAAGSIIFDTTDPLAINQLYSNVAINDRLAVVSWFQTVPDDPLDSYSLGYSARVWLFYHTAWNFEDKPAAQVYSDDFSPVSAVILSRNIFIDDQRQGFTAPAIEEGYNTQIQVTTAGPATTTVLLSAGEGYGLGPAPCDLYPARTAKELDSIHRINGQAADKYGNFLLVTEDDCWGSSKRQSNLQFYADLLTPLQPYNYTFPLTGHLMTLGQACRACPDCDDYNDLIDRTNVAIRKFNRISEQFPEMRDRLKLLIDTWNANVLTKKRNRLQLAVIPQACPMFEIAVTYTNFSNLPKNDIVITLTLTAITGTLTDSDVLLQPHGHYNQAPETNRQIAVSWPVIDVTFTTVKPFRSEFAVLTVPLGREGNWAHGMIDPTDVASTGMTVRVTASVTVDGRPKRAGTDWTISEDVILACSYTANPLYPTY